MGILLGGGKHSLHGWKYRVSSEIAAIPLLWVIPLALYLITFIIVFEFPGIGYQRIVLAIASLCLAISYGAMIYIKAEPKPMHQVWASFGLVFFGALLCHGFLYALRPPVERLTAFYLSLAAGSVIGGVFVAMIAPNIYDRLYEIPAGVILAGIAGVFWVFSYPPGPWRFIVVFPIAATIVGTLGLGFLASRPGIWLRDFFGTVQVRQIGDIRTLSRGNALHGAMCLDNPNEPMTFFNSESGLGMAFGYLRHLKPELNIGIVGLGSGSIATYAHGGDSLVVYEESPAILLVAGPFGKAFPLLKRCPASVETIWGDGRVSLSKELQKKGPRNFDLLIVDPFCSESMPWHYFTIEALKLFMDHLAPDGLLVIQASTQLPLDRVVCSGANTLGIGGFLITRPAPPAMEPGADYFLSKSYFILLARNKRALNDPVLKKYAAVGIDTEGRNGKHYLLKFFYDRPWTDQQSRLSDLLFDGRLWLDQM